jgi:uncharacterized protein YkwD
MGRHSRTAPEPVVIRRSSHRKVKVRRRRRSPVRTGLLASSAALAVSAVAVSAGLLPVPNGSGGYSFRDVGSQVQAGSAAPASSQGSTSAAQGGRTATPPHRYAKRPGVPTATVTVTTTATAPASPERSSPAAAHATKSSAPASWRGTSGPAARPNPKNAGKQLVKLVNEQRAKVGCAPVVEKATLGKLAQGLSKDMAKRHFFDHTDPDGNDPWDRAGLLGILNLGGENIARGQADAAAVMDAWMNSAGHRANILNCDFRTLGVGFASAPGGPWWTQDFGY